MAGLPSVREEPGPSLDGGATNAVKAEDKARTHASMHRHQRYSWADIRGTHGPTSEVLMGRHQRYSWADIRGTHGPTSEVLMGRHQRYSWADIRGTHEPTSEVLMDCHRSCGGVLVVRRREDGVHHSITLTLLCQHIPLVGPCPLPFPCREPFVGRGPAPARPLKPEPWIHQP